MVTNNTAKYSVVIYTKQNKKNYVILSYWRKQRSERMWQFWARRRRLIAKEIDENIN